MSDLGERDPFPLTPYSWKTRVVEDYHRVRVRRETRTWVWGWGVRSGSRDVLSPYLISHSWDFTLLLMNLERGRDESKGHFTLVQWG